MQVEDFLETSADRFPKKLRWLRTSKIPKMVEIVKKIPETDSGKIDKKTSDER